MKSICGHFVGCELDIRKRFVATDSREKSSLYIDLIRQRAPSSGAVTCSRHDCDAGRGMISESWTACSPTLTTLFLGAYSMPCDACDISRKMSPESNQTRHVRAHYTGTFIAYTDPHMDRPTYTHMDRRINLCHTHPYYLAPIVADCVRVDAPVAAKRRGRERTWIRLKDLESLLAVLVPELERANNRD